MAVATDAKTASMPDLDDLLQCPVCYEVPSGHIYQCNEGHHVCGFCKSRIDVCPVCRSLFFGTRNYAMEELIANFKKFKLCKSGVVAGSGTSESTESADTSLAAVDTSNTQEPVADIVQEGTRPAAPVSCGGLFRCLCCKNGTAERLPMARMLNHLRYWHALSLVEGKSERGEYVQAWQFPTSQPDRIVIAVRISDMGIFFLVIEITDAQLCAWVSMAAAPWAALNFCYSLTISGNDREAVFSDSVWSTRSCEGQLKKRLRCLLVSGDDLRALIASRVVSGRLSIKRSAGEAPLTQPRAVLRVAYRGTSDAGSASVGTPDQSDDDYGATVVSAITSRARPAATAAPAAAAAAAAPPPPQPASAQSAPVAAPPRLSRNARRRMRRQLNREVSPANAVPPGNTDANRAPVPPPAVVPQRRTVSRPAPLAATNRGPVATPANSSGASAPAPGSPVGTVRGPAAPASRAPADRAPATPSQSSGESSQPSELGPRRQNKKGRARR